MDHEVGPWKMVRLPWSDLLTNQFTWFMGPSLGVNQTWINRNEDAPKNQCADFILFYFDICSRKIVLKERKKEKDDQVRLSSCLRLIFP